VSRLTLSRRSIPPPEASTGQADVPPEQEQQPTVDLDRIIQQQVGEFQLQQSEIWQVEGATDARSMVYQSPDGVRISHALAAYRSSEEANEARKRVVEEARQSAWREYVEEVLQDEEEPVGWEEGPAVGCETILRRGNDAMWVWTNENLLASIQQDFNMSPEDFIWELPYRGVVRVVTLSEPPQR
jgi:hypothetical protein